MPVPKVTEPSVLLTTQEAADLLRCSPATLEVDRVRHSWRVPFLRWLADRDMPTVTR
jgi:hypothetical protein